MTNPSRTLRHAVRFALAAMATAAVSPLAHAQTAPASSAPAATVQDVVVTGSRISQAPNDVSISPITSVTSIDIQQSGLLRTEDLLNSLPQVTAEQGSGLSISSNGTATVSLRGLGSQRTLVLVNGRRLNPGAGLGTSSTADVNQIPADLIQSADVLTGGASAVYGADAVAGVVNFVLNTHYEGVKFDANYGFYNHKNDDAFSLQALQNFGAPRPPSNVNTGQTKDISFVAGGNFADGRGNATVYATYMKAASAVGYQYDHAGCTLITPSSSHLNDPGAKPKCGGSGTSGHGQFLMLGTSDGAATTIVDHAVDPTTGVMRPFDGTDLYNYGALSYFQRPAERFTSGAFLHYEFNEHADVYSELMYSRNTSSAQYGPSGDFFQLHTISCDNPLLTAQELTVLCNPTTLAQNQALYGLQGTNNISLYIGRRNVEGGGRIDNYYSNSIREVLGVKGKIDNVWSYDVSGQIGITQFQDIESNFLGTQQITNALNVVADGNGNPACVAALNGSDPTCVPWNIWVPGGVTQAALDYMTVPSSYTTKASEYIASANVSGDLGKYGVKLPTAASGLQMNIGTEYRQEVYDFIPDYIYSNGFASGGNGAVRPIHGEFHVAELFTEMRLPLVDEKPGIYQLSTEAGYRYSDYTSGFSTNTYKFGVEYAPIQDIRFRGSYNRAIRAPSIGELYSASVVGAGGTADPCWGASTDLVNPTNGTVNGHDFAFCQNTGVTAAQFGHITVNPAAQINTQAGGNPTLKPEVADTYSFGVVFQSPAIANLVVSLDYFDIKIKQTIQSLTSNTIINNCGSTGSAATCDLIHRGPTGSLWLSPANYVEARFQNIGTVETKGIDLKAHYALNIGSFGKLNWDLTGVRSSKFETQPLPSGGSYDCAGYWGSTCNAPLPKWRHNLMTNWATPWGGLDVTLKWRFIGASDVDSSSTNPLMTNAYYPGTAHIKAYSYVDLSASMPLATGVNFRLGINNIADKNPPVVLNGAASDCPNTTCNDNTWAGTYDALGRYIYAHLSVKF